MKNINWWSTSYMLVQRRISYNLVVSNLQQIIPVKMNQWKYFDNDVEKAPSITGFKYIFLFLFAHDLYILTIRTHKYKFSISNRFNFRYKQFETVYSINSDFRLLSLLLFTEITEALAEFNETMFRMANE